jgi:DNA-binding transcriptional regulator YdaS (Cro superfamily)
MNIKTYITTEGRHRNQAAWARHFGITRGYLNQLVNGSKVPSLATAVAIHHATGGAVTPFDWFDNTGARDDAGSDPL